jgi:hypothetical protein
MEYFNKKMLVAALVFASIVLGRQTHSAEEAKQPTNITQINALIAVKVALVGNDTDLGDDSNALRAIWRDEFAKTWSVRQDLAKRSGRTPLAQTNVFMTKFEIPSGRMIVSATSTPSDDCSSFSNVGLPDNLLSCPMKVAIIQGNEMDVVYNDNKFVFSIGLGQGGAFDNSDIESQTSITFEPSQKILQSHLFAPPVPEIKRSYKIDELQTINPDNVEIKLSY